MYFLQFLYGRVEANLALIALSIGFLEGLQLFYYVFQGLQVCIRRRELHFYVAIIIIEGGGVNKRSGLF